MIRASLRRRAALVGLAFAGLIVSFSGSGLLAARGQDARQKTDFAFRAFEGFDGKLGLNWKPVRPDPTHVSLTKHPGALTITTQRGSIHGEEKTDTFGEGIQAKNLYLVDNPLAPDADFTVTACVSGFTPKMMYQQAGLILYNDDDNYVKFGYEFDWGAGEGQVFYVVVETNAVPAHTKVESSPSGLDRYWVRLTRHGKQYEYATSTDGDRFTTHGAVEWGGTPFTRIGILAKNGGSKEATEIDAHFETFEIVAPPASGTAAGQIGAAAPATERSTVVAIFEPIQGLKPVTRDDLVTRIPNFFSFDYPFDPQPGKRLWLRVDDASWVERYPDGSESRFKVVGRASVRGQTGTVVAKIAGDPGKTSTENDGGFQVLIPDKDTDRAILFRTGNTNDAEWQDMSWSTNRKTIIQNVE